MQEQHRLAVGSSARFAVSQDARALCQQVIARGQNVGDFVTQVMHAAGGISFQEPGNRRIGAQGVQQFDFRIWQLDEGRGNAVIREIFRSRCQTLMLQPRAQPGQRVEAVCRNQRRDLKRNSFSVRAPTGQRSTTFPE